MATNKSQGMRVVDAELDPGGYVQLTTLSSATGLSSIPNKASLVMIQPEVQNIRWRDDGTNPTASVGNILYVGDTLVYNGDLNAIKFIEVAASAKLNISYYK